MDQEKKEILILGAGNVGRGIVGDIFHQNGYRLLLYRRQEKELQKMKQRGYYTVAITGKNRSLVHLIDHFEVVPECLLVKSLAETNLVACCVYEEAFPDICRFLAQAIRARMLSRKTNPLNLLLCTNRISAMAGFQKQLFDLLALIDPKKQAAAYCRNYVGICQVLVLGASMPASDRILVQDEFALEASEHARLEIDRFAFKGEPLRLQGVTMVEQAEQKLCRKVYLGNMRHTMAAFMGSSMHLSSIAQCHRNSYIRGCITAAFREAEQALLQQYSFEEHEYRSWKKEIMEKLDTPSRDSVLRVAHDPIQKLSREDRFVAPALLCMRYHVLPYQIARGIAYGFDYKNEDDRASLELNQYVHGYGIEAAVMKYCGLNPEQSEEKMLYDLILAQYYDKNRKRS